MRQLVLATGNVGKVQEFALLLAPLGWAVLAQSEFAVPECPEPHPTFIENALAKARHAAVHTGLPALADDSGLCVRGLQGAPGVHSARYAALAGGEKSDAANNARLLEQLRSASAGERERQAYFTCALVAVRTHDDPEPLIAIGRWHGSIALAPSGNQGFGYDPLFVCAQTRISAASMSKAEKSARGHRGQAVAALLPLMRQLWGAM